MPVKKRESEREGRVEIRMPLDLKAWAQQHASEKHTTVTQLVIDFLTELKIRTEAGDVDQI